MKNNYFVTVVFENSRPYYFETSISDLKKGDKVVVETVRGIELGTVDKGSQNIDDLNAKFELKPILRLASDEDVKKYNDNLDLAKKAFDYCAKSIESTGLDMKLLQAQYVLDRSKVIFIYASDDRVDFRDLLKDLASQFRCRIELRQIGSRDRAKLIGGLGACGMPLCCASFMNEFDNITINMAKNQFLALNIQKLSGQCGKLMCCLKFEDNDYTEVRKELPKVNTRLTYNGDNYKITSINILTSQVRLENATSVVFAPLKEIQELVNSQNGTNNK